MYAYVACVLKMTASYQGQRNSLQLDNIKTDKLMPEFVAFVVSFRYDLLKCIEWLWVGVRVNLAEQYGPSCFNLLRTEHPWVCKSVLIWRIRRSINSNSWYLSPNTIFCSGQSEKSAPLWKEKHCNANLPTLVLGSETRETWVTPRRAPKMPNKRSKLQLLWTTFTNCQLHKRLPMKCYLVEKK